MSLRQQVRLLLVRRRQNSKQRQSSLLIRPAMELGIQPRRNPLGTPAERPLAHLSDLAATPQAA